MDSIETVILTCDLEEAAIGLRSEMNGLDIPCAVAKRENLDGSTVTWIVVANTAIAMLPKILDALARLISAGKVRTLKIGDLELTNPNADDLAALKKRLSK